MRIELIDGPFVALDGVGVAVRLRSSGTMTGALTPPGFAPTGGALSFETAEFSRFDDAGLLAHHSVVLDVQRFFRAVLTDGQPIVAAVEIEHRGSFNLPAEGPDRWRPFSSTQHVVMRRPGFVWDGRVAVMPGLAVHVHDAYVAGEGILHPAVMGLVSLADIRGSSVVLTPWEGRWSDYAERDGMRVPMRGEVAWVAAEGLLARQRHGTALPTRAVSRVRRRTAPRAAGAARA